VLAAAPIKARQACFRPVSEDGLPFIGAVPGVDGAYVATGHSVWGMLNAPATGEAMSELILDGAARHVDLAPFAPGRLLHPVRLRDLPVATGAIRGQFRDPASSCKCPALTQPRPRAFAGEAGRAPLMAACRVSDRVTAGPP
jgi:hypothetical protein